MSNIINLVLPISKKVMEKVYNDKNSEKVLTVLLETWAASDESTEPVVEPHVSKYIKCLKNNIQLSKVACMGRQVSKKRGCNTCKLGKLIKKIDDLHKQLKDEF